MLKFWNKFEQQEIILLLNFINMYIYIFILFLGPIVGSNGGDGTIRKKKKKGGNKASETAHV